MPLTDRTKNALTGAIKSFADAGLNKLLLEKGAAFFLSDSTMDVLDFFYKDGKAISEDIRANREEAEKLFSGLIGASFKDN